MHDVLQVLFVEVVVAAVVAVAAAGALARAAWRELAAARARHDELMDAARDATVWHQ